MKNRDSSPVSVSGAIEQGMDTGKATMTWLTGPIELELERQ